jgi:hypothetical protein
MAIETLDCANMAICTIGPLNKFRGFATPSSDCGTAQPQKSGRLKVDSLVAKRVLAIGQRQKLKRSQLDFSHDFFFFCTRAQCGAVST